MQPKHSGKSARYFSVLNCTSAYGLSSNTQGRLWRLVMSRSPSQTATGLKRMLVLRSACSDKRGGLDVVARRRVGDELLGEVCVLALGEQPAHPPSG